MMTYEPETQTLLVLMDMQERFAPVIDNFYPILDKCQKLVQAFQILDQPILLTEQYPEKLGPTVDVLQQGLNDYQPIAKTSFSAYRESVFRKAVKQLGQVTTVVMAGIEAHVCVYQTAYDLLQQGFRVEIVEDAVSSRTSENREIGLKKILQLGAFSTSTEMIVMDLLRSKNHDKFKDIQALIK